jgi:hypothetical protein
MEQGCVQADHLPTWKSPGIDALGACCKEGPDKTQ